VGDGGSCLVAHLFEFVSFALLCVVQLLTCATGKLSSGVYDHLSKRLAKGLDPANIELNMEVTIIWIDV
jgi:hypothetical protein